jgi:type I restriction enzyme M protein
MTKKNNTLSKDMQKEFVHLESMLKSYGIDYYQLEQELKTYNAIKTNISTVRHRYKKIEKGLMDKLEEKILKLYELEAEELYLDLFYDGLDSQLSKALYAQRQSVIAAFENWWDKYQDTYTAIAERKEKANAKLSDFMKELGYVA